MESNRSEIYPIFCKYDPIFFANEAIQHVKKMLPQGSVNKKSDELKPNYLSNVRKLATARDETETISYSGAFLDGINRQADIYEKYGVGNCFEQCIVALRFLKQKGVDDVDMCQIPESEHWFLVINGSIICDPWANSIYHASKFTEQQKTSNNIEYADIVWYTFAENKKKPVPYLSGIPESIWSTSKEKKGPAILNGHFVRSDYLSTYKYNQTSLFFSSKTNGTNFRNDSNSNIKQLFTNKN